MTFLAVPDKDFVESFLMLLLDGEWVARRKLRVEYLEPGVIRQHLTLDVDISSSMPRWQDQIWLPVASLRKAPGQLFSFDFVDQSGTSLPVRTSAENRGLATALLIQAADLLLGDAFARLRTPIEAREKLRAMLNEELREIAAVNSYDGLNWVINRWPSSPSGNFADHGVADEIPQVKLDRDAADALTEIRSDLAANSEFWWLIQTVAHSSFLPIGLQETMADRIILKLSYDERIADITDWRAEESFEQSAKALTYLTGFRSVPVKVFIPWATGRSFHFEVHVPEGLAVAQIARAGTDAKDDDALKHEGHFHTYYANALALIPRSPSVAYALADSEYGLGPCAACLAVSVMVALAAYRLNFLGVISATKAGRSISSVGTISELLLVIPGLVATYLAGSKHPVAKRLSTLPRLCLLLVALVSFSIAARMSVINSGHAANANHLVWYWLVPAAVISGISTLVLIARQGWRVIGRRP